jgi:hypothetical protein
MTQIGIMGLLVTSRDQGMSSEEAQARFHHMRPDLEIPRELAANVFDFPELGMRPLERYTLWSCHAQAHMIRTLPLKEVAAHMRDCYANARPQECAIIFQNRITGLPADYRPKSSLAPVPARP